MFSIYQTDDGHELAFQYLPCAAMTPRFGMAMKLSGGRLALASGTDKPEYICCREEKGSVAAGTVIPVVKVEPAQRWRTKSASSFTVGAAYTLSSTGMGITTTTTNGVFTVDDVFEGFVYGRFI